MVVADRFRAGRDVILTRDVTDSAVSRNRSRHLALLLQGRRVSRRPPPNTTAWCETHKNFHDRRADPDATYNTVGGGTKVYGNKFVIVSATTGNPNETFILDTIAVSKPKALIARSRRCSPACRPSSTSCPA